MRILTKFGGSSLSNAEGYQRVKEIILENKDRTMVVVSAPGKDSSHPTKMTDLLMLLHAHIEYHIDYANLLDQIYQRYHNIEQALNIQSDFNQAFNTFKEALKKGLSKDEIASRGELFQAILMSAYLGFEWVDAKTIIKLGYDGEIDNKKTEEAILNHISNHQKVVIPGFYGATPDGSIRIFERGGSDLTGSILCQALKLKRYENWTDVDGLYVIDPKYVKEAKPIEKITFKELRELSYRGAEVIFQESLIPLEHSDISLIIKNTFNKDNKGTLIAANVEDKDTIITGMTASKDYVSLTLTKDSFIPLSNILKQVFELLNTYKIRTFHIPTGIDSLSLIISNKKVKDVYFDLLESLHKIPGIQSASFEEDLALIAVVGRNMAKIPGIAGKIFSTLGDASINIKVIAQASNEMSIMIGIKEEDLDRSMKTLYHAFYSSTS